MESYQALVQLTKLPSRDKRPSVALVCVVVTMESEPFRTALSRLPELVFSHCFTPLLAVVGMY